MCASAEKKIKNGSFQRIEELLVILVISPHQTQKILGLGYAKWKGYDASKNTWEPRYNLTRHYRTRDEFGKTVKVEGMKFAGVKGAWCSGSMGMRCVV